MLSLHYYNSLIVI